MLFALSLILFVVYTAILVKAPRERWMAWGLSALYFLILVLFGDFLRGVFGMGESAKTFFYFIAVVYAAVPVLLAEITARLLGRKAAS